MPSQTLFRCSYFATLKGMFVIVRMRLKILIEGALSVALSIVLSYIKLFSLPQGGSIVLYLIWPRIKNLS